MSDVRGPPDVTATWPELRLLAKAHNEKFEEAPLRSIGVVVLQRRQAKVLYDELPVALPQNNIL